MSLFSVEFVTEYLKTIHLEQRHILRDRRPSTDACPAWCSMGVNEFKQCTMRKKIFCTEQPRQNKNFMYRLDKPNEPNKEGSLSFVLFESPFTSVSTVSRGHPSLVSLTKNHKVFFVAKNVSYPYIKIMSKDLNTSHLASFFLYSKSLCFIIGILIFNVYLSDSLLFSIFLVSLLSSLHGLIFFLIVLCDSKRLLSLKMFLFCAHCSTLCIFFWLPRM